MTAFEPVENPLLSDSPRAWDDLFQSVGPASLLVAIESRLGSSLRKVHAAEDILQEALLHAWNSPATCEWRGVKAFRSWLLSIIDNRIRDAADRQSAAKRGGNVPALSLDRAPQFDRHASTLARFVTPSALVESTTPSRLAMYREHAMAMQAALQELPDELRDVVRLRLVEQMSLDEIAQSLGLGVAAVRHRFRKGAELYHNRLRVSQASRSHDAVAENRESAPPRKRFSAPDG